MVTLGTLGTSQQLPFRTLSKTATHNTHILKQKGEHEKGKIKAETMSLFVLHLKVTTVVCGTANVTG